MKGDFTRVTFDPLKHFSGVLMQQGRVQLDADFNEHGAILLHLLRTLSTDLIGPHGGPEGADGFEISIQDRQEAGDFTIGRGRYYVDGILCEIDEPVTYKIQPDFVPPPEGLAAEGPHVVYLEVWERHVTWVEDEDLREVALGGPDTASRSKVVWQVRALALEDGENVDVPELGALRDRLGPIGTGLLAARALQPEAPEDPCTLPPEAAYRGPENQLYRVEVHAGSRAPGGSRQKATFKWSRDNGTVVFPIRSLRGKTVVLDHLGRDKRFGVEVGDWVEVVDDAYAVQGEARPLYRVEDVDPVEMQVILGEGPAPAFGGDPTKHPLLRRWDQKVAGSTKLTDGAVPITPDGETWVDLEDGVQVRFASPEKEGQGDEAIVGPEYRTGDYWLIPARTATADVEWPGPVDDPESRPPRGVQRHHAPLALATVARDGKITSQDRRKVFRPSPPPAPRRGR